MTKIGTEEMKDSVKSLGRKRDVGAMASLFLCALVATVCHAGAPADGSPSGTDQTTSSAEVCPVDGDPAVTDLLRPIRQKYRVPAIAGLILTSKGVEMCGVVGVRKSDTEVAATVSDKWHLGSCTKAMTATLVGIRVERGLLKWDATVADIFPDWTASFHPEAKGITVVQLLSHRAGLQKDLDWRRRSKKGSTHEQRVQAAKQGLSQKPRSSPGSEFEYSNLGYVIAGAIIEKVTGMSWEQAMKQMVFNPLEMKSAGFGGTGTPGVIDQPWGHLGSGQPVKKNGPRVALAQVQGPAGTVHCTIQDWARFVADQLRGARGETALLKSSTYHDLHTPRFGGSYALGWHVRERGWGGGTVLTHAGSDTMNKANVWIAPRRDFAILVCVNQGDDTALKASDEAVTALHRLHASENEKNRP